MLNRMPDLVQGLAPAHADAVLALGATTALPGGGVLFRLGDAADALYVIDRGHIALRLPIQIGGGDRALVTDERGAGETVGWSALIPPHRFTLEAVAVVDSTVIALPRALLQRHFEANPAVGWAVTQNLASIVGQRLQIIQAMWLREMQRVVELRFA